MSGGRNEDRWDRVVARWIRSPLVSAFGVTRDRRVALVRAMFQPEVGERPMYWLRLLLAMGIATLGLVLGSTAAIIGAMLISPLMSPIVELGMGIAVGLPRLALRSFARVAASAVVVCACAAAITTILPFQEVTPPIAERTAPTVLDLGIAIFCALMAAFGTATSTSTAATHAAGTAIGIALVPPICVVGFGIGAGRLDVAGGAALLFVTNFSAIILFAVLTFIAFGFNDFDVDALGPAGRRIAPLWRLVLPTALLAIVFVLKVGVVRPPLNARTDLVLAGANPGESAWHYVYIGADLLTMLLLIVLAVQTGRAILALEHKNYAPRPPSE